MSVAGHVLMLPNAGALTLHGSDPQDCDVSCPAEQEVAAPDSAAPSLHASWQLAPDASVGGHSPSVPFRGAVTVHGSGSQRWLCTMTPSEHEKNESPARW